ncbi:MAG: hypothetical protein KGJ37_02735, partial [Verrucomicrobiota bacterium]|nr:hypothetical protein [Verrucomicrobiota bacterium]
KTAVALNSIFGDRLVIKDAVFDVAFITIVKNVRGQTNIDVFRKGLAGPPPPEGKEKNPPGQPAQPAQKKPPKQFLIRHLVVKLDKIIIADYSTRTPNVREVPLTINRTFTDVTDLSQISAPLLTDLSMAGVGRFAGDVLGLVIPAPILESLGIVTKGTGGILKNAGEKTTNFIKGLFDSLEEKPKK